MKDFMMLIGFSIGLVTGALMYKYCDCARSAIDQGEKAIKKEIKNLDNED